MGRGVPTYAYLFHDLHLSLDVLTPIRDLFFICDRTSEIAGAAGEDVSAVLNSGITGALGQVAGLAFLTGLVLFGLSITRGGVSSVGRGGTHSWKCSVRAGYLRRLGCADSLRSRRSDYVRGVCVAGVVPAIWIEKQYPGTAARTCELEAPLQEGKHVSVMLTAPNAEGLLHARRGCERGPMYSETEPYKYIRHPTYSATSLAMLGTGLARGEYNSRNGEAKCRFID